MTVAQLINALQQVPPNLRDIEVRVESTDDIGVSSKTPVVAWFNKNRENNRQSVFVIETE